MDRVAGRASLALALYVLAGGLLSLLGWLLDVPVLTDWDSDGISIQPNATLAATLAGASLLLARSSFGRAARVSAALVALLGASALMQYVSGRPVVALNTMLMFGHEWGRIGVVHPGLMGPPGSLCWTLLGVALVLATRPPGSRARRIAVAFAVVPLGLSSISVVGYLFGVDVLYSWPTLTVIALQTATFVAATAIAVLAAIPERAPLRWLLHPGTAGRVARRTVPALVAVPLILGWTTLQGSSAGLYDWRFAIAILVFVLIGALVVLFSFNHETLVRHEDQARQDEIRKNRFLATLAHELRNPLAPIRYSSQLLHEKPGDADLVLRASQVIARQTNQLARLVDDLLDVSRITHDRLVLRNEVVDVEEVVVQAVEATDALRQGVGHELHVLKPESRLYVEGDRARLTQVLSNLLHNASKFMPPRGRISLAVAREGDHVSISVRDEGEGLAGDQLTRIFEPFVQVDSSPEKVRGGLGLGLWLSQRLVRMHGGTIEARSEGRGRGAEFTLRLPLLPPR